MHVDSACSTRSSIVPASRTPWQRHVRHLLLAIAATGLLAVGQATAQEADEPASAQADVPAAEQILPSVKPDRNGRVCQYEDVTGSRMKKRVCYTPEQWEARERAAKELTRELDNRPIGERRSN